ncbi:Part of AAA domain-containing protein [Blastococcus fimeti]|nr:Part of AAA domain-containing protein [Blastococcus fimeti]
MGDSTGTDGMPTSTPTPPGSATTVDLTATKVLSYPLAHNRVPVVSRVTVTNSGTRIEAATLRLSVHDAEGAIGAPVDLLVDLEDGGTTVLTDVPLRLDPAAMLQVEEQRPGRVEVEVVTGDAVVARGSVPVQVLAAGQWLATPLSLALEMLAAHVMPNHPSITALVAEASDLLQESTGSSSVQGYQSGAGRVDQIVAALTEAMRRRTIRYSEPPASWADMGQKVRTPAEVLDGRIGTCLDTVVVLAAALEQAGIRPLLWLVDGHAFLGYWREEIPVESAAMTDAAPLVNLVDLGLIGLIETTMLTGGEEVIAADLHRRPYTRWLTGDLDQVLGVVDIHRARQDSILPLPARTRDADGTVHVVEYRPAVHSVPPNAVAAAERPVPNGGRAEVPARVQQWKNALLDLSLRNRLINYTERSGIALTVPDDGLARLEDMVVGGTAISLLPSDQIAQVQRARGLGSARDLPQELLAETLYQRRALHADVGEVAYLVRFRSLAYKAKTIVEETGANNLYLALGSLAWELDGRSLRSPLVLVPVLLTTTSRGGAYRISLDEAGTSTPNYCLLEKLRQLHGLSVPGLEEPTEDGAGIDLDAALQAMRVALAERGLPYRVEATADLAILQFAKFRLWKDLDEHWADFSRNSLVDHLVNAPTQPFADPVQAGGDGTDLDELAARCPVPGDASQLRAVAEATAGRTFVLEGPPGTGKSQTITNLLTRAVADGKRVLFVAEKRAALDVVSRRLAAVGMSPFALDLHDKGSKPAVVRTQIRQALDHAVQVDEQGLATEQENLRSARRTLARYAQRLHEPNGAGLSLYSARTGELTAGTEVPALPVPAAFVATTTPEDTAAIRQLLAGLPDLTDQARPRPAHPWAFVDTADVDVASAQRAALRVSEALDALPGDGRLAVTLRAVRTPSDLDALARLLGGPAVGLDVLDETRSSRWTDATRSVAGEVAAFVAAAHPGLDVATPAALDLPLADIHAAATAAASSSWFGRKKRLIAVREQLAPALRPDAEVKPKAVPQLTAALLQVQTAVRGIADRAAGVPGLAVPARWNPLTDAGRSVLDRQVEWLRLAGDVVDATDGFPGALRALLAGGPVADPSAADLVSRARDAVTELLTACRTPETRISEWTGAQGLLARWSETRAERAAELPGLPSLRHWSELLAGLERLRAAGLDAARQTILGGGLESDEAVRAFDRGVAQASVEERRTATGLDGFDAERHGRAIRRFAGASRAVRDHLRASVPAEVLGSRPFDPATAIGQVGALQRELAKQRRGLGVRALLSTYGDLITAVMPCVLVSPDSVARFFPAVEGLFDLVVFDEASQIRVADSIGALGRARAAVVVGDSKQMPPTTFAEPSSGGDDEEESSPLAAVEDEESILSECVQARVPRQWLSWHYRSQDESLIAFSNRQYYENRLSSFPAPVHGRATAGHDGRGVSLVRVDGQFHRSGRGKLLRTNPVEAEAVVAEIRRRFAASPDALPSLGVVTFNQQQRAFIEALLRDTGDERLLEALDRTDGEGLFVKNLENVQGDERDAVLFSTGFSVNERGVLPLNFGPLNRAGGERRLNVAVTRARRQVVVFTSFDPAQLRAEETSSVGIKHLRAYLDLAAMGTGALPRDGQVVSVPDRHREEIAAALRSRGLVVRTDVGLSDFKIDLSVARPEAPDAPVMAVLLDGPAWAGRGTVGDRDGLPLDVLGGMLRWPAVERVWLPSWLADPEAVMDRLVAALDAPAPVVTPPSAPAPAPPPAPAPMPVATTPLVVASAAPDARTTMEGEGPFVPWQPGVVGDRAVLDQLSRPSAAEAVRTVLMSGISAEGPIHVDRLARLTAAAFGLGRVAQGRKDAIAVLIPDSLRKGEFVWPRPGEAAEWAGFRRQPGGSDRPLEHVAPEEIGNAMVALCRAAAGMTQDELFAQALDVFGYRRRTPAQVAILEAALDRATGNGRLALEPSGLLVARVA